MFYKKKIIICLMGITASGKTKLSIELSKYLPIEIISVDSTMVYRFMNIGTAKPNKKELLKVNHHLINIRDPLNSYSLSNFIKDSSILIKKIFKKKKIPLLVGGTMLYFKKFIEGYYKLPPTNLSLKKKINNEFKKKGLFFLYKKLIKINFKLSKLINLNDKKRILRALEIFYLSGLTSKDFKKKKKHKYKIYKFSIKPENKIFIYKKIKKRFNKMIIDGLQKEVNFLLSRKDLKKNTSSLNCPGYKQMFQYIKGKINYNEMISRSIYATRHVAKKQITWLKKFKNIYYIKYNKNIIYYIKYILKKIKK